MKKEGKNNIKPSSIGINPVLLAPHQKFFDQRRNHVFKRYTAGKNRIRIFFSNRLCKKKQMGNRSCYSGNCNINIIRGIEYEKRSTTQKT